MSKLGWLEKKLIIVIRMLTFNKDYGSHRRIRTLRKLYPLTEYRYVQIKDLQFGHPVNFWLDWRLRRRVKKLKRLKEQGAAPKYITVQDLQIMCPSDKHIETFNNIVLNGNGRVFALKQAGYDEHYIYVERRF